MLPSIKKQIQEKNLLLQNLEQQKQGIKYQNNNIDNAREQQKHLADELISKITIWRAKVEEKQLHDLEEQKKIAKQIQARNYTQQQEQFLKQINKKIIPDVLKNVEENLIAEFALNAESQSYIKNIVDFLEESKS
jgi:predicted transglutaminase-like protease